MTDNMKKFLEEVSKNVELQDQLIKANNDYFQAVTDAVKEQGISATDDDIALLLKADKNHDGIVSDEELASLIVEELLNREANEDELTAVAGGAYDGTAISDCFCIFGGGGTADDWQKTCACVFAGVGELTEEGKRQAADGLINYCGSASAPVAMYCPIAGLVNVN